MYVLSFFRFFLIACFFSLVYDARSQGFTGIQRDLSDTIVAKNLLDEGKSLIKQQLFTEAREKIKKSKEIYESTLGGNCFEMAYALEQLAVTNYYLAESSITLGLIDEALAIRLNLSDTTSSSFAFLHNLKGIVLYSKGFYDDAIDEFIAVQKLKQRTLGSESTEIAALFNNIGASFGSQGKNDKALEFHEKALSIYIRYPEISKSFIANSYSNIGVDYFKLEDYEKAIEMGQIGLNLRKKLYGEYHLEVAQSLNNIGGTYTSMGKYYESIEMHEKALSIKKKILGNEHPSLISSYTNLAYNYAWLENIDKAIEYYQMALATLDEKHPNKALTFRYLSEAYLKKNDNISASRFIEEALSTLNYHGRDSIEMVNSLPELIETFKVKINIELKRNKEHPDDEFKNTVTNAIAAINYQIKNLSPSSRVALAQHSHPIFESAIIANNYIEHDTNSFPIVLGFSEQSKALILLQSIQDANALIFSGIPDSLLEKEYSLRIDLTYYDKQRQEKLNSGLEETDTTVLRISSILFDLRQEYEALKTRFEKEYPEYYRLKYDLTTASLAYVQDTLLSPAQTLLEYFVGDSSIFIFTVGKGRYDVVEVKKDFPLEDWVKQLQHGLYGYHGLKQSEKKDKIYEQTVLEYADISPKLYEKLIAPVKEKLSGEVIVVPDGVLGYVPFEVLLTATPSDATNFTTYPFLVKDYRISYCYSATLLREMKEKRHKQPPTKPFVAFAPFYEGSYEKAESTVDVRFDTLADGRDTVIIDDVVTRKEFKSLPASGEETATAAKLWKGEYFLNADATEQRFYDLAGGYRIVHLSTHGIADARVGDYSYLAFAEQKDSIENEFLFVRDLYNTQLNADLVVLSACETAQGELQRGEGIISLARAFAYAGAKSIVTTLWTVDDSASKDLTKAFYLQLRKGKTKDAALQAAKLKLVNSKDAKRQHPFFWAGFIGVGDMSAIK